MVCRGVARSPRGWRHSDGTLWHDPFLGGPVTPRSFVADASLIEHFGWLGRDGFSDGVL